MNKIIIIIVIIGASINFTGNAQDIPFQKVFFSNSLMKESYFFSKVTYMGNSWIKNVQGKLPVSENYYFTPGNALELKYKSAPNGTWSTVIEYDRIRGIDSFINADVLVFYFIQLGSFEPFRISLIVNDTMETPAVGMEQFIVKNTPGEWNRVSIPLKDFNDPKIANITGIKFSQSGASPEEQHIVIDEIELARSEKPLIINQAPDLVKVKGYEHHFDLTWHPVSDQAVKYIKVYRSVDNGKNFDPVGIQIPQINGYADFVDDYQGQASYRITFLDYNYNETAPSKIVSSGTRKLTEEELLDMVQESQFRYYWDGAEPNSGLALENIPGRPRMIATGASGFGVMAIITGVKRGFITRQQAVDRFIKILDFLAKTDRFHGVFPHFLDGRTGKVVPFFGNKDNGADLVETSFLMQGLITAREFFDKNDDKEKQIREVIDRLWQEVEWDWFRHYEDPDFLIWHWSPDQEWVINHKLIGWNETMITYFLAIASPTHAVPASMYYSGWASQSEEAKDYRMNWGQTAEGSAYVNGNTYYGIQLPVGVSTGGPLFFVHYSYLGLDPHRVTDRYVNYFENNQRITKINYRYCIENPEGHTGYGEDCWGLTASDGPYYYFANEPKPSMDQGKMTPTGALASFPYLPKASLAALRNYYENYGHFLYGYYGFRDSFNLSTNWCSPIFMGLNQAPNVVMIENYRSGFLWDLFMSAPEVGAAIEKLEFDKKMTEKHE